MFPINTDRDRSEKKSDFVPKYGVLIFFLMKIFGYSSEQRFALADQNLKPGNEIF